MDRVVRMTALAAAAFTLLWMSGCGEPVDVKRVQQDKQQAAADEQAAWEAKLAEGPTPITREDYWRVEKKEDVSGGRIISQSALMAKNIKEMDMEIKYNLKIHGEAQGYPKSHEEFLELIKSWNMSIPKLKEPYEVWYDAETHEVLKRPKPDASPTPVEESPVDPEGKPTFE
ncbi:hypothetical protein Pla123a_15050 [Posidoniimonas polymericola]|uniref:Lipoprotein n=1 Tax=Posidoniimonas polymericola TaxID=2528002 RepID=A0A5C5YS14_9BACT|nr:hypothetical protein [Posidoniimonas polymericola]TWT77709.1 hypothetical protein Pla123a_15050 [Posidoniimonas polymericola]